MSIPLLGAVDTGVMGHLPDPAYLGGVAVGALIFSYIYWGFGFLRMGTTGLVAQARGAGDPDEIRAVLMRGWLVALTVAMAVLALQGPIGRIAFAAVDASAEVERQAGIYFAVRIWGAPAQLLFYVALGFFFGMQRMGAALALTVAMNAANIALDLLFVVGLGMGIRGVALATVISVWSAVGLGLWLIFAVLRPVGGRWERARVLDRGRLAALVAVNANIFIRTLCLISAFAWFTALGARIGDVVLAANAVLLNFQTFSAYALDGFAHAAEAIVGSAFGARDPGLLRRAVRVSTLWAGVFALLFAAVYALSGTLIVAALTGIPDVREAAARYLPWVIATPLVSVWSYQLDGIYIGATRTADMRNGMVLSFAAFLVASWALLPVLGNHGLWLALMIFMAARAITLGIWYPRLLRRAASPEAATG